MAMVNRVLHAVDLIGINMYVSDDAEMLQDEEKKNMASFSSGLNHV